MGVRANRVISGAFAFAGFLAGVAAVLILMRTPSAEPTLGSDWLSRPSWPRSSAGSAASAARSSAAWPSAWPRCSCAAYLPDGLWERLDRCRRVRADRRAVHRPAAGAVHRAHRGARVMDALAALPAVARRVATAALFVVLARRRRRLYTATGGAARDLLVQELLINLILVLGLQVFIGNTGILSFGHLAFAQIAAYGAALVTIPAATQGDQPARPPFGLGDVELGPVGGDDRRRRRGRRRRRRRRHRRRTGRRTGGDDDHARRAVRRRPGGEELDRS